MKDERVEAMAVFARPNSCEGVGAILAVAPLVILSAFILPTSSFRLPPSSLLNDPPAGGPDKLEQKVHFCRVVNLFVDFLQSL